MRPAACSNPWPRKATNLYAGTCGAALAGVMFVSVGLARAGAGAAALPVEAASVAHAAAAKSRSAHGDSFVISITPNGEFVLFASTANDIVSEDRNSGFIDLFVKRRSDGCISLVTKNVSGTGGGAGNSAIAGLSQDGRCVVFESDADDLVPNDTNRTTDIFLRDMVTDRTILVSVNNAGSSSGNGRSYDPVITPDGRFVAFISTASDLVANDNNQIADVFIRDLQNGITKIVSVNARSRSSPPYAVMTAPVVSSDGRYVAFSSTATGLIPQTKSSYDEVYVRDLLLGVTIWGRTNLTSGTATLSYGPVLSEEGRIVAFKTATSSNVRPWLGALGLMRVDLETGQTDVVSRNATGIAPVVYDDYGPAVAGDGRWIAFADRSTSTTTARNSVWLWDAHSGSSSLISANVAGQPTTDGFCGGVSVSADGRFVVFASNGSDLVTNALRAGFQVYLRNVEAGLTKLISRDREGIGVGDVDFSPVISACGQFVGFETVADSLVEDDLNSHYDAFVFDTVSDTLELVSEADPLARAVTANNSSSITVEPVSDDGRFIVFESLAGDIVPDDTNGTWDVFVRDLVLGTNGLVSVTLSGGIATNGASVRPSVSGNGRFVVFTSSSDELVNNDTNRTEDVFVRDLLTCTTMLVSVATNGYSGNNASSDGSISADGRWVAFQSQATDLAPYDSDNNSDIYVRDLQSGATFLVSTNSPGDTFTTIFRQPVMSPDGRFVVFEALTTSRSTLRLVDLQDRSTHIVATNAACCAFSGNSRVFAVICPVGTTTMNSLVTVDLVEWDVDVVDLGAGSASSRQSLSLSDDGRFVAFSSAASLVGIDTNGVEDVFLFDRQARNLTLISVRQTGETAANGRSYWPRISQDAQYVAFRSTASDLVPNDNNDAEDIFLFDRNAGQRILVTHRFDGDTSANGFATGLAMSADGTRLVFGSVATDLVSGDFNGLSDVFTTAIPIRQWTDSDSDGLDDAWEKAFFGDLSYDGGADPDADGHTNHQEYKAGTNPMNATSVMRVDGLTLSDTKITLRWLAAPGRSYKVQYSESLTESSWTIVPGVVKIVSSQATITDDRPENAACRFYRLELVE